MCEAVGLARIPALAMVHKELAFPNYIHYLLAGLFYVKVNFVFISRYFGAVMIAKTMQSVLSPSHAPKRHAVGGLRRLFAQRAVTSSLAGKRVLRLTGL